MNGLTPLKPNPKKPTATDKVLDGASAFGTLSVLVMIGGIALIYTGIIHNDSLTSTYGVAAILSSIALRAIKNVLIGLAEITEASRRYNEEAKRKEFEE